MLISMPPTVSSIVTECVPAPDVKLMSPKVWLIEITSSPFPELIVSGPWTAKTKMRVSVVMKFHGKSKIA
jgi:hypothetical protein